MAIADSTMVFDDSGLDRRLLLLVENGVAKVIASGRGASFDEAAPEGSRRFRPGAAAAHALDSAVQRQP